MEVLHVLSHCVSLNHQDRGPGGNPEVVYKVRIVKRNAFDSPDVDLNRECNSGACRLYLVKKSSWLVFCLAF